MDMAKASSSLESYALALLRIVAGFTFTLHGAQKIVGAFGGLGGHTAAPLSMLWFAGILEIIGGPLIILGLFTRPVAFLLCGEMAVAYFRVHIHMGPWLWPILNNGEITVLYCFLFLYLVTAGAGAFSLDDVVRHKT
jgi:putative oxidoreductase